MTLHGKPEALLVKTSPEQYEETLSELRRVKAKRALLEMQLEARRKGLDKMTMAEIDAEIKAVRREKKKK